MKRKQKNKELDFVALASHQLRTPLTIVKGYLSMILEGEFGAIKETKLKAALLTVYQANERLVRLVDNLLGISRLNGKLNIQKRKFDFMALTKEVIKEMKPKAKSKNLLVGLSARSKVLKINGDNFLLRQVLLNLLDNAIKYTTKGRVKLEVTKVKNKIIVTVSDTGPGLDIKELKGLFGRFENREVKNSNQESFGLGLYASKLIIQAHKGKIWAETRGKDFGFKVSFELPV